MYGSSFRLLDFVNFAAGGSNMVSNPEWRSGPRTSAIAYTDNREVPGGFGRSADKAR